jgi:hypothetical protein
MDSEIGHFREISSWRDKTGQHFPDVSERSSCSDSRAIILDEDKIKPLIEYYFF